MWPGRFGKVTETDKEVKLKHFFSYVSKCITCCEALIHWWIVLITVWCSSLNEWEYVKVMDVAERCFSPLQVWRFGIWPTRTHNYNLFTVSETGCSGSCDILYCLLFCLCLTATLWSHPTNLYIHSSAFYQVKGYINVFNLYFKQYFKVFPYIDFR